MPPHCDTLDGPVVGAARQALESGDVTRVLPFVQEAAEEEVRDTFEATLRVRSMGVDARDLADRLFFETVVRLHRLGEGEPYTGLKPAGQPEGPVIPLAEKAVESGSAQQVAAFLTSVLQTELDTRLGQVQELREHRGRSVPDDRRYVQAMLGFEVYTHHVLKALHGSTHG